MTTLYRRPLPAEHIAFSSEQGRALFRQALEQGTLEPYFRLSEQHHTQADPSFCGLGALVVALNALSIDPGRQWKGPWRWFSEELLDCCFSLERVRERGLTLEQVACLASCNGAKAEVALAQEHSEEAFREALSKNARQAFGQVLIVSYDRSKLGQTGAGHFSPLAGYHEESDSVLVLDVARFKYPSHWLRVKDLFAAMLSVDPQSNKSRGWLTLTEATESRRLALAFESTGLNSPLLPFVGDELNRVFTSQRPQSVDGALDLAVAQLAPLAETIQPRSHADTETQSQVDAVLCQLRNTPLFSVLSQRPQVSHPEVVTGLLMCFPSSVFAPLPTDVASALEQLRMNDPPALHDEPAW